MFSSRKEGLERIAGQFELAEGHGKDLEGVTLRLVGPPRPGCLGVANSLGDEVAPFAGSHNPGPKEGAKERWSMVSFLRGMGRSWFQPMGSPGINMGSFVLGALVENTDDKGQWMGPRVVAWMGLHSILPLFLAPCLLPWPGTLELGSKGFPY